MARDSMIRERILEAAVRLLMEAGVKKLAQPQVAKEAGVPQGHLTYYFPKRSDLIGAVITRFRDTMQAELSELVRGGLVAGNASFHEKALSIVGAIMRNRERTRMMLGLVVEADSDPQLRGTLLEGANFIRSILASAMNRPDHDPDVDIALAALWGLGLQHLLFQRSDEELDKILERLPLWLERSPH